MKHPMKYGRDSGERKTIDELTRGLGDLVLRNASDNEIADYLDREFLYGAWGFLTDKIENYDVDSGVFNPMFTRDVRGLVLAAFRHGYNLGKHGVCNYCEEAPATKHGLCEECDRQEDADLQAVMDLQAKYEAKQ